MSQGTSKGIFDPLYATGFIGRRSLVAEPSLLELLTDVFTGTQFTVSSASPYEPAGILERVATMLSESFPSFTHQAPEPTGARCFVQVRERFTIARRLNTLSLPGGFRQS
jgi:hypothetical protein